MHDSSVYRLLGLAAAMTLSACAAPYADGEPESPPAAPAMLCDADAAAGHIGHPATQAMGSAILADSGAAKLRWGPPGAVWTMDFRQDRVNVRYDQDMTITDITCG